MPFTPLHMGPGLAIKALAGHHFSVLTFGIAQVAMDIEPLIGLFRGSEVLHGTTHRYLASLGIAVVVAAISPTICRPILRRWNRELFFLRLTWLAAPESFSAVSVIAGAFSGTISHVILDSAMHSDISPLAPWSNANTLQGLTSIEALHQFCIFSGLFGVAGWLFLGWYKQRKGVGHEG